MHFSARYDTEGSSCRFVICGRRGLTYTSNFPLLPILSFFSLLQVRQKQRYQKWQENVPGCDYFPPMKEILIVV